MEAAVTCPFPWEQAVGWMLVGAGLGTGLLTLAVAWRERRRSS
jgi:hypothetical protein